MTVKFILLSVGLIFCSNCLCFTASAQCAIDKIRQTSFTVYAARNERVFINEDLENGLMQYDIRIIRLIYDQKTDAQVYYLECFYASMNPPKVLVPRAIDIHFKDGKAMYLPADTERPSKFEGGVSYRGFLYKLSFEAVAWLQTKDIQTLEFSDTRTGQTINTSPYPQLLSEQVKCIQKHLFDHGIER